MPPDTRDDYGEERGIGTTHGRVALVAFTEKVEGTIRVVSLRKATNEERKEYEKALKNELEAN